MRTLTENEKLSLLNKFKYCNDKYKREKLMQYTPFLKDDKEYICTTDSYRIIYFPITNELKKIAEYDENKTVNVAKVIPEYNENIKVGIKNLCALYNNVEIVDLDIKEECESCDGEGEFQHYGDMYDCKNCNEKGYIITGQTKGKDINTMFQFKDCVIKLKYIEDLLRVIEITETDNLAIEYLSASRVIFSLDEEIYIFIAAYHSESDYTDTKYKYLNVI